MRVVAYGGRARVAAAIFVTVTVRPGGARRSLREIDLHRRGRALARSSLLHNRIIMLSLVVPALTVLVSSPVYLGIDLSTQSVTYERRFVEPNICPVFDL